jgi:preprotein translocase subunit YajC
MDQLPLLLLAQQGGDIDPSTLADPGGAPAPGPGGEGGTPLQQPPGAAPGPNNAPPPADPFGGMWLILLAVFAVMIIFTMTSSRKEKKKRQSILENLRKGAKVRTVGGILGTIVEVRDDEVVVKVDENANTRLRFSKSAIQDVTSDEKKDEKPK